MKYYLISRLAEEICRGAVFSGPDSLRRDRQIDKVLTSRVLGFPIMLTLLALVFFITITGANYPSQLLSDVLFKVQDKLIGFCISVSVPEFIYEPLLLGVYRVLAGAGLPSAPFPLRAAAAAGLPCSWRICPSPARPAARK